MAWDSPLGALHDLVEACADGVDGVDATAAAIHLTRLVVEAPIELQARVQPDGTTTLDVAPPRQAMATTVMPVLHRIRVEVVADR